MIPFSSILPPYIAIILARLLGCPTFIALDMQLIEGTRYELTKNSRWQYQRLKDGKTVEQRMLPGELPAIPAAIPAADQALTAQARQVLRQQVTEMADRLHIAAPSDMLDEKTDPCAAL